MVESKIKVYTDGGNRNRGNKAGQHVKSDDLSAWAYLIVYDGKEIKDSGFALGATNNAMELTAVGKAFRKITSQTELANRQIELISDSHYVLDPMSKGWLENWIKSGKERPNWKMWQTLYPMYSELKDHLTLKWVKGHDKTKGNLRVDEMLNHQMDINKDKIKQR